VSQNIGERLLQELVLPGRDAGILDVDRDVESLIKKGLLQEEGNTLPQVPPGPQDLPSFLMSDADHHGPQSLLVVLPQEVVARRRPNGSASWASNGPLL
jgi:hypothetical protein